MTAPDPRLLLLYGTSDVYQSKLAENKALPLAAVLAGAYLGHKLLKGSGERAQADVASHNQQVRLEESMRNAADVNNLRGGTPAVDPFTAAVMYRLQAEANQPMMGGLELDKGAAAQAAEAGKLLAKSAGIGGTLAGATKSLIGKLPVVGRGTSLKTKALVGLGLAGTGALALKGGSELYRYGMQQPKVKIQGSGLALPRHVNEWGQPV